MFGKNRDRIRNRDTTILNKFTTRWNEKLIYPKPTDNNVYMPQFCFTTKPDINNIKGICDGYFMYKSDAKKLERFLQRQRSLMTFNFASQSQNAEVRHLFEDNTDIETLESRILFYESRSHQLNANIFDTRDLPQAPFLQKINF